MTTMRWMRSGSDPRGAPRPRLGRRSLALVALAVAGLLQSGCQSGMFGPCSTSWCGPCGFFKNMRERVFRPRAVVTGGGCCGGSEAVTEAPVLDAGAAPAVVSPAPAVVVPPTTKSAPEILEPAPSAIPSPAPGDTSQGTGTRSSAGKASYEVLNPQNRYARKPAARPSMSIDSSPAPTSRSAQGAAAASTAAQESSPLDNLPPLELPKDLTSSETSPPPVPPVARDANETKPTATASPPDAPASKEPSATINPSAPAAVNATPGLRRFVSLEPKLAGGSLPSADGLEWLAEKGYKTLLDLRESSDVQPAFIADVTSRGLRYVALPISVKNLDADHVSRFLFELSLADARPLYFCDADGTRAGALWYIRRIVVDKMDPQVASREAEELGLTDRKFWLAASSYLDRVKAGKPADSAPSAPVPPTPANEPAKTEKKPAAAHVPAAAATTAANPPVSENGGNPPAPAAAPDPTAWRSMAALLVTGLGAPLAYVSRTAFPTLRQWKKASLPGPGPRPKSLPAGSGD